MASAARSPSRRAIATAVRAHAGAARVLATDLQRAGEAAEHADAELRGLVAERRRRPLEQVDRERIDDPGRQHAFS